MLPDLFVTDHSLLKRLVWMGQLHTGCIIHSSMNKLRHPCPWLLVLVFTALMPFVCLDGDVPQPFDHILFYTIPNDAIGSIWGRDSFVKKRYPPCNPDFFLTMLTFNNLPPGYNHPKRSTTSSLLGTKASGQVWDWNTQGWVPHVFIM